MYDVLGFGARLQKLRKQKNMTQEDLALRIGVTGQAVSKWENDQSYPDITLIPTLAEILDTDIHYLFGKATPSKPAVDFPETYNNMPLVHSANDVACYSNKEVASKDSTGVKFADGSTAELSNRLVVNQGQGDITLVSQDTLQSGNWKFWNSAEGNETEKDFEFGTTDSAEIAVLLNECEIVRSADDKTRVHAEGAPWFMELLQVNVVDNKLVISFDEDHQLNNVSKDGNHIVVEVPYDRGQTLDVEINGSGTLISEIPFYEKANVKINGSGCVEGNEFGSCRTGINGSGELNVKKITDFGLSVNGSGSVEVENTETTDVTINGSGDVVLGCAKTLTIGINGSGLLENKRLIGGGDVSVKISGSGNVQIGNGDFTKGTLSISGSGEIHCGKSECDIINMEIKGVGSIKAKEITTRIAHIVIHQKGDVVLGHVTETATEQIKEDGTIKILKRGKE